MHIDEIGYGGFAGVRGLLVLIRHESVSIVVLPADVFALGGTLRGEHIAELEQLKIYFTGPTMQH